MRNRAPLIVQCLSASISMPAGISKQERRPDVENLCATSSDVPLAFTVGGVSSPSSVTVAVR